MGTTTASAVSAITPSAYGCSNRSMSRCVPAFWACASSTIAIIRAIALSDAGRVTRTSSAPPPLIVPPNTSAPSAFGTGTLSPVSDAWSTSLRPLATTPSSGSRSPGVTRNTSPTRTASTGTSTHWPSRWTRAESGRSCMSASMAERLRPMATCWSTFESENRNRSMAPSKGAPMASAPSAARIMSRSMSAVRCRSDSSPARSPNHPPNPYDTA